MVDGAIHRAAWPLATPLIPSQSGLARCDRRCRVTDPKDGKTVGMDTCCWAASSCGLIWRAKLKEMMAEHMSGADSACVPAFLQDKMSGFPLFCECN